MAKIVLSDVVNILGNPTSAQNTINSNSDLIEAAFENTLSRDGTSPNQMEADFDMNHNDILNVKELDVETLILNGEQVGTEDMPLIILQEAIEARDLAQAWAEGTLPGGPGTKSAKEWAAEAQASVADVYVPEFVSVAAASAATIPVFVKRIRTNFHSPNFVTKVGLNGGANYRRVSLLDLTSYPSLVYFRSVDRFLPDGTVDATNGGFWVLDEKRPNVHMAGARGDAVTNDAAAINAISSYVTLQGGGDFDLFPTGSAYYIGNTEIVLGNGAVLNGSRATTFPGTTAPKEDWFKYGVWIYAANTGSAVKTAGHGSGIRGVAFWNDQPIPTGSAYSANSYGYAIEVASVHTTVEDIIFCNTTRGIILNYTSTSGGGTYVSLRNILAGCIVNCLNTTNVNDTIRIENFHCRAIWHTEHIPTVYFANCVGWDCGYTDNCIVDGFEAVFLHRGIYFRNQTCLGNTHSLYNGQIHGLQLSLCGKGMEVENANAVVTGQFTDIVLQQGDMFGLLWSDECLSLNSNFIDFNIGSLRVNDAGGQIMTLGHTSGSTARVRIDNLDVLRYSSQAAGQVAFDIRTGSILSLGQYRIRKIAGAGARFAGTGSDAGVVTVKYANAKEPFGRFNEFDVTAGSTGWVDLGTDLDLRPGAGGIHQARVIADFNVITQQAGTNLQLRFSALGESTSGTISSATTGWKNFDTGWFDITEAAYTGLSAFGRPQINMGNGVRVQNGKFILLVR